jgi:hypothetical protein
MQNSTGIPLSSGIPYFKEYTTVFYGILYSMEYCFLWNIVFHEEKYWNTSRSIVFYEIPESDEILEYILYSNSIPPTTNSHIRMNPEERKCPIENRLARLV